MFTSFRVTPKIHITIFVVTIKVIVNHRGIFKINKYCGYAAEIHKTRNDQLQNVCFLKFRCFLIAVNSTIINRFS